MGGYTKLFSSILASTVWRTDHTTRIVWITLLAMADKRGIVESSVPGLADFARVSMEECQRALELLKSPDEWSRSKIKEGRRIEDVDGGWFLINHDKFRKQLGADERREYLRQKQAEYRKRKQVSTSVTDVSDEYTKSHIPAPTPAPTPDPEEDQDQNLPGRATRSLAQGEAFKAFWQAYPRKVAKGAALKAWTAMKPDLPVLLKALKWQISQPQWRKEHGQFIPYPATWLRARGWEDEPFHANGHGQAKPRGEDWTDECSRLHQSRCSSAAGHKQRVFLNQSRHDEGQALLHPEDRV